MKLSDRIEEYTKNISNISNISNPMTDRLDEPDDETIYQGWATVGSNESDSVWRIKKIFKIGTITKGVYADGNTNFDNKWTERTVLTYI